jgi:spore coat polysaccharide biosynthesis protein SpsF
MGSKRLPKKMAANLGDRPLLAWVLTRCKLATAVDNIFLLTSERQENQELVKISENLGVRVFIGDEADVASRFAAAAKIWPADHYLRVCADNPFVCPVEISRLASFHILGGYDYSFNHIPALGNNYVDGFGAEIFTAEMIQRLTAEKLEADEKEHVTRYFWNRRELLKFGVLSAVSEVSYPELSFDIDTLDDLEKIRSIVNLVNVEMPGAAILETLRVCGELHKFANLT